jgi:hypothetical protein
MLSRGFRLFVLSSAFLLSVFLITADRSQAQDNTTTTAAADEEKLRENRNETDTNNAVRILVQLLDGVGCSVQLCAIRQ